MKTDLKKKGLKTFSLFCFEAKPIQVLSAVSLKQAAYSVLKKKNPSKYSLQ